MHRVLPHGQLVLALPAPSPTSISPDAPGTQVQNPPAVT